MLKDKRGLELTLENLIGLVVVAILLVGMLYTLTNASVLILGKKKLDQAKTQLDDIIFTLNSLEGKENVSEPYTLWIPEGWFLAGFPKDSPEIPKECWPESCLCICPKKFLGGLNCEKGICKVVKKDIKIKDEIKIEPKEITLKTDGIMEIVEGKVSKTEKTIVLTEERKEDAKSLNDFLMGKYPALSGLGECIIKASQATGIPYEVILAVTVHESTGGTSGSSKSACTSGVGSELSNNLFGMTADYGMGSAGKCLWPTWECYVEGEYSGAVLGGSRCTEEKDGNCKSKGKRCYTVDRYFRAYNTKCDSIMDFVDKISKSRYYKKAMENKEDPFVMINLMMHTGIFECGVGGKEECSYASDPLWDEGVIAIAKSIQGGLA